MGAHVLRLASTDSPLNDSSWAGVATSAGCGWVLLGVGWCWALGAGCSVLGAEWVLDAGCCVPGAVKLGNSSCSISSSSSRSSSNSNSNSSEAAADVYDISGMLG